MNINCMVSHHYILNVFIYYAKPVKLDGTLFLAHKNHKNHNNNSSHYQTQIKDAAFDIVRRPFFF